MLWLRIVQWCSHFGSSNSNDYISQINLLADFYILGSWILPKSLDDFLFNLEPLQYVFRYIYVNIYIYTCEYIYIYIFFPQIFGETCRNNENAVKTKWTV